MSRASIPVAGLRRALVVDDSGAMRSMLRAALEQEGFAVREAANGKEALIELATGEVPELALIDWSMPELDGVSLIRLLRSELRYDRMAIVMVTSETDPAHVERALEAGADEYIMKPLSQEVLCQKLLRLEEEAWS